MQQGHTSRFDLLHYKRNRMCRKPHYFLKITLLKQSRSYLRLVRKCVRCWLMNFCEWWCSCLYLHYKDAIYIKKTLVYCSSLTFLCFSQIRYDGTSDLATVESYDPVTNAWQPEVTMGTRRSCLGVAVLHGLLYAAGGYDGASCLNRYTI